MNKWVKYALVIVVAGLLGYNSVYIKKLSAVNQNSSQKFDATAFATQLWRGGMQQKIAAAVELPIFMQAVTTDKEAAFKKYSNALGVGNYRYALIKTEALVTAVNEDEVQVQLPLADSVITATLATEYIYGNAIRDASALVDVKDYPNTGDLNAISEALNKIVRSTVVPEFKKQVKKGDKVNVTAAVELNKEHVKWRGLELLPVKLQIVP